MLRRAPSSLVLAAATVALWIVTGTAALLCPRSSAGAGEPTREVERQRSILRVTGPNDGEPINNRFLRLQVESTFADEGVLFVFVNGRYFTRATLRASPLKNQPGVHGMDLDVDLQVARTVLGINVGTPESGPVSIGVHLHQAGNGSFVAYAEWVGWVGRPWIDILPAGGSGTGDAEERSEDIAALGRSGFSVPAPVAEIHTLGKDVFYLLLASQRADDLRVTRPESTDLLRRVLVLAAGPCVGRTASQSELVSLDSLQAAGWTRAYLVLWTYSPEYGWRQSELTAVAWK
jgi:hypothetical protein